MIGRGGTVEVTVEARNRVLTAALLRGDQRTSALCTLCGFNHLIDRIGPSPR